MQQGQCIERSASRPVFASCPPCVWRFDRRQAVPRTAWRQSPAEGSGVCVLIRRLNSSCSRSMAFVVRADRHWLSGKRAKVNSWSLARISGRRQPKLVQSNRRKDRSG